MELLAGCAERALSVGTLASLATALTPPAGANRQDALAHLSPCERTPRPESSVVRHHRPAPTLPTPTRPPIEFVKINMPGEHQESRRNVFSTSPGGAGKPATGDGSRAFRTNVVAGLGRLTDVINQRLQFGPFRSQQDFAVELGGQDLVFGGHAPSHSVHGPRKSEPSARVLPPGQLRRRNEVTHDRKR